MFIINFKVIIQVNLQTCLFYQDHYYSAFLKGQDNRSQNN